MRSLRRGFTLIELVVVMMILGLAAALVFPRLTGGVLDRTNLKHSVSRLASTAIYAHHHAACTAAMHRLHLDIESGAYWVTSEEPPRQTDEEQPQEKRRILEGKLPSRVRFLDVQMSDEEFLVEGVAIIRFGAEGWADSAAIHLVGAEEEIHTVLISGELGRIETYDSRMEIEDHYQSLRDGKPI